MVIATKIGLIALYFLIGYIIALVAINIVKKAIKMGLYKEEKFTNEKNIIRTVVLLWPIVLIIALAKTIFKEE